MQNNNRKNATMETYDASTWKRDCIAEFTMVVSFVTVLSLISTTLRCRIFMVK